MINLEGGNIKLSSLIAYIMSEIGGTDSRTAFLEFDVVAGEGTGGSLTERCAITVAIGTEATVDLKQVVKDNWGLEDVDITKETLDEDALS